jgi:hypothetical protein
MAAIQIGDANAIAEICMSSEVTVSKEVSFFPAVACSAKGKTTLYMVLLAMGQ